MNRYLGYALGYGVGVVVLSVSLTIYYNWLPFLIILVTDAFPISWFFVFHDVIFESGKPAQPRITKTKEAI